MPLSFAQERLWFLNRMDPTNPMYNLPLLLRLRGALDLPALSQALSALVARHEPLRTGFRLVDGEALQVIGDPLPVELPVLDLRHLTEAARTERAERTIQEEALRPFDLLKDRLLRTVLLRTEAEEHLLLVAMHHIVTDGWSLRLMARELAVLYEAYATGISPALPALPVQYADFAVWQRERLGEGALAEQLAYWRRKLDGAPALLELPTDRPRPALQSYRGAWHKFGVDSALVERLAALTREEGATLFMTVLAVFKLLLHRYAGQDEIVVGMPVANRNVTEVEGLIGFFVNSLPLRTDLSGAPTFRELLRRVRETALEAYAHQDVPFEKLVEALAPERNPGYAPIYQVAFDLQAESVDRLQMGGLEVTLSEPEANTAKFDLTLHLAQGEAGLNGTVEYNTDLFDAATVERMAGHFRHLLEAVVAEPDRPVAALPLMGEVERQAVLALGRGPVLPGTVGSGTGSVLSGTVGNQGLFHEIVAAHAAAQPEAAAIEFAGQVISYREMERRANHLANQLRDLGVAPGVTVGVCTERSPESIIGILAAWKAGGVYVPLDPSYPSERLSFMLEDAGVHVLLTQSRLAAGLPAHGARIICMDAPEASGTVEMPVPLVTPDDPAYIIYTSGSTGKPKGVLVAHRSLANLRLQAEQLIPFWAGYRTLPSASFSFDASILELTVALGFGGTYCMASRDDLMPGAPLRRTLEAMRPTHTLILPAALALTDPTGLTDLQVILSGGEQIPADVQDRWAPGRRFLNVYGPTECTVIAAVSDPLVPGAGKPPIGRPLANSAVVVVDRHGQPVPMGVPGELLIGGECVAIGYLNRPELTAERFVPNPFPELGCDRLYRSGDLVKWRPDGQLEYLGRIDSQVKLRGQRLELGEVEAVLLQHPDVVQAAVLVREDRPGDQRLVAYVVGAAAAEALRMHMRSRLPSYMVPSSYVLMEALPLTANGKVNLRALPVPDTAGAPNSSREQAHRAPTNSSREQAPAPRTNSSLEQAITAIWREVLGLTHVDRDANFFDLGGHSLLLVKLHARLQESLGREIPLVTLFQHPSVGALIEHLQPGSTASAVAAPVARRTPDSQDDGDLIAVVAMAGRFPGAANVAEFWSNLREGVESLRRFTRQELEEAGEDTALIDNPAYVPVKGLVEGADLFDARFFNFTPRDAEAMDPQQRIFLEVAWEALESAGYDPDRYGGRIGLWAGSGFNSYLMTNLAPNKAYVDSMGLLHLVTLNDKDFLATRTAYKLNLHGPAVTVQSACSTSLVAIHMACQSLRDGTCDMAMAGGVSIATPLAAGHLFEQGSILSPDGHCRAFAEEAQGTVNGSGAGVVVLKRLADALRDGDTVHAVIRGSAINNDGARKVGYAAPGVEGQAEVIDAALADAGVAPDTIGYLEAHGTGTPLGDPIEVAALNQAYRQAGAAGDGPVYIGSVKTNMGHLDTAAGVTGFMKAVLAVKHGELPPSLHAARPSSRIDFGRFQVNDRLRPWPAGQMAAPRRAGISAFGIGGTNAHVIVEQAPHSSPEQTVCARPYQLLPLAARTRTAVQSAAANLAAHLNAHEAIDLADAAFTLQNGRHHFGHRAFVVAGGREEAAELLQSGAYPLGEAGSERPVLFLFPGQGAQYGRMGHGLYETEPVFREAVDRCAALLEPHLGLDLRTLLNADDADEQLRQTALAQPALFTISYAMASLWLSWGIQPQAMLGHSLGEYVAATLAGVFSLEDALALVAARGRLCQALPAGAMLGVNLAEANVLVHLEGTGLSVAAVNGPAATVVAGETATIEALAQKLEALGVTCRRLHTSHAFHSAMMEGALAPFAALLQQIRLQAPTVPFVSNLTGTWITPEQATDPAYWVRHLREAVRFADGLATLCAEPNAILLEVGPGQTLSALARQNPTRGEGRLVLASMRHPREEKHDLAVALQTLGRLWMAGARVDWAGVAGQERRRRIPLPTYPFERQRYWVDPPRAVPTVQTEVPAAKAEAPDAEPAPVSAYDRPDLSTPYTAPASPIEEAVVEIWAEVLGIARVGVNDDFFELGGDSIMAAKIIARMRSLFPVDVPVTTLFEAPTVALLALAIEELLIAKLEGMDDDEIGVAD